MLEGLDQLNWEVMECAVGSAQKVPELIRQLTDRDPIIRERAFNDLDGILYHQGTIYEASVRAIPFLLELLADPHVPDKGNLFDLLLGLVPASGSHWDILTRDRLTKWHKVAYDAMTTELTLFLSFLDHPDKKVRKCALDIVSTPRLFPEMYVERITNALKERIALENVTSVKAIAVRRLGEFVWVNRVILGDTLNDYADLFYTLWQSDEEKPVPFAAVLSLVKMLEDKSPDEAVDFLIKAIITPKAVGDEILSRYHAISTLWHLGFERSLLVVIKVLHLLDDTNYARYLAEKFLERVFGKIQGGKKTYDYPKPIASLTDEQRQAVHAIVEADIVWEEPHNLLEAFGLPEDRDEMRRLLG